MIDLTPLEVRQKKGDFRRALRGYDPELVNDFLDLVADRMEELVKENLALRDAAGSVQDELTAYRHKEQALSEALMSAQKLREDARDHAEREGDLLLREARLAAETLRQEAARQAVREEEALRQVRARRVQLVESFRRLLEREMNELDVIQETLELGPSPLESLGAELTDAPAGRARKAATPDIEAGPAGSALMEDADMEPAEREPAGPRRARGAAAGAAAAGVGAAGAGGAGEDLAEESPAAATEASGEALSGTEAPIEAGEAEAAEEAAEEAPLNLEWPGEDFAERSPPEAKETSGEKRVRPEGFDAADASDEDQDDWLSSLMEE